MPGAEGPLPRRLGSTRFVLTPPLKPTTGADPQRADGPRGLWFPGQSRDRSRRASGSWAQDAFPIATGRGPGPGPRTPSPSRRDGVDCRGVGYAGENKSSQSTRALDSLGESGRVWMIGKNSVPFSLPFMGRVVGAQRRSGGVRTCGVRCPFRTPPWLRCAPPSLPIKGREKAKRHQPRRRRLHPRPVGENPLGRRRAEAVAGAEEEEVGQTLTRGRSGSGFPSRQTR